MNYNFLSNTALFFGISPEEIKVMLGCLKAEQKDYGKNGIVLRAGDAVSSLGLVLSGSVNVESDDVWGNKSILDNIGCGQVFAETYACLPGEPLMVNVVAAEPVSVLFLSMSCITGPCRNACGHHGKLIRNLLSVTAEKNLNLSRRIFHTSSKTIRGRLLSYLSFQAVRQGSCQFSIPFNRQQLADYLGVDRSAMSNELGKMQREGMLKVEKNRFRLGVDGFEGVSGEAGNLV